MYIDSFVRNPGLMLKSMLYRVQPYWVIDAKGEVAIIGNQKGIWNSTASEYDYSAPQAPELGIYRHNNFLTKIMDIYCNCLNFSLPSIFIWRFGFWTALMAICAMLLIFQKQYLWLLAYIPVFIYLLSLYLTNLDFSYRYGLPIFFIGLFLPPLFVLSSPSSPKEEEKQP
jgi:hypothetical protein